MSVCIKCSGQIDVHAHEMKRELSFRLGKPYTPPKVCTECLLLTIMAINPDEEERSTQAKGTEGATEK